VLWIYDGIVGLINRSYGLNILEIGVLMEHYASKVFLLETATSKYALKQMKEDRGLEDENKLNKHLSDKGIKIPKIYLTVTGEHIVYNDGFMYILYEFIDGKTRRFHTVPDWLLIKQAQTLGEIQNALKDYKRLPLIFGKGFHTKEKCLKREQRINNEIESAEKRNDVTLTAALYERLRHIRKISEVEIDCNKLTYVNSHGDFYLSQIIERDGELVVIDWVHPRYLPACNEIMMSYMYAAPECRDGTITAANFAPYLREYMKYTALNRYDLEIMPYFTYFYCIFCSFTPPYDALPGDYNEIARITDKTANWLCENADKLSSELCKLI
jgi:Ser/Thr protein kinase RdoA (MazF antagonist)